MLTEGSWETCEWVGGWDWGEVVMGQGRGGRSLYYLDARVLLFIVVFFIMFYVVC